VYCDESAFEQRFGEKELAELLPDDEGDDGRAYAAAASDADSLIDSYLAARYAVPLSTVPPLILGIAADLTRHELYDDAPPKEVEARYERAIELLEQIRDGELLLPGVETLESAAGGAVAVSARAIAFDECTAHKFMGGL
jgi:phage gp36-like protein